MRLRRMWLILLLVLLLPAHALADCAINGDSAAVLIAADGSEIVPVGEYTYITPLKDGYWCAIDAEGKRALLNASGESVTGSRFDELRCVYDTILYREGDAWGILSDDGTPLVAAKYSDIRVNGEGDFIALRNAVGTGSAQNVDFLDAQGNETAIGVRVLYGLNDYSEGYMPVLFAKSGRYGYLDTQGVVAFEGQYIAAGPFQDGYAIVTTDEGTGMINYTGRMAVPAEYDDILRVGDIALLSKQGDGVLVLRLGGEQLVRVEGEAYISEIGEYGLILTQSELLLIDSTGAVAGKYPATATVIGGENGQIIVSDGLWGEAETFVSLADGTQVGEKYQSVQPLNPLGETGYYAVSRFDATPVTDETGAITRYEWSAGDIRYAIMDDSGTLLSDFTYTMLRPAEADRFFAATGEKYGVINAQGNWLWVAPDEFMAAE